MIGVLVVDDHPLFAQGTAELLDRLPDIQVLDFVLDLDTAVHKITELEPDVVVCDVMLGDRPAGLELPARLIKQRRHVPVLFLSEFASAQLHARAIDAGAAGYLRKTVDAEELRAAILSIAAGATVFPRSSIRPPRDGPRPPSPREVEILALVADGRSNSEVAAQLGISGKTVETHMARLFERYGTASRTQLAIFADRRGWLRPVSSSLN